ncbi:uncharacterized protein L969DRAFT_89446 [Mixia osmundae IAM 14324]|uniref:Cleft lip and palate transmembrane 1 n=1 Tax=Mixia osmundae (strain CBS 9802 / IAM 14324 / JCM 22182 / KY 12970) TaxID=764103 RepID=G7DS91_MIXOS|nr:uncharacterized protein L969DRAFT_89446 [Mixia osmundae IAM 14324]KEI37496.1 hypothetical protein L969DRAFT_89446 [Mixia osmundae IAM 14324]GAA93451.1 hypothetical protein E5Q_00092 [Mixia osmundae IAM 14324]
MSEPANEVRQRVKTQSGDESADRVAPVAPATARPPIRDKEEKTPIFRTILNCVAIYIAISFVLGPSSPLVKWFKPQGLAQPATSASSASTATDSRAIVSNVTLLSAVPAWPLNQPLDLVLQLTTSEDAHVTTVLPSKTFQAIPFGEWEWQLEWFTRVDLPASVSKHNASLYLDAVLRQSDGAEHHVRQELTRFMPLKRPKTVKRLIGADAEEPRVAEQHLPEVMPIVAHWHPNITLALVSETPEIAYSQSPPIVQQHIALVGDERDADGKALHLPILLPNLFWQLKQDYQQINSSVSTVDLRVTIHPSSYFKFQLYATMHDAFEKQASTGGGTELDEVKRIFTSTNPILLGVTIIVTLLHSLLEMLAFGSDVAHWRQKRELTGVSVRTLITNVAMQVIIFLYLLDNNDNTSWTILIGQGMGIPLELWKISKAVTSEIVPSDGLLPYKIVFKDKHVLSEDEKATAVYDKLAFRYVSMAVIPSLFGYTIYSLMYNEHKGWYSFSISTLTSFVYAISFATLVPQLIINYHLKSVAHLPMKSLTFKFLNTIIDDLFAFVVKMPTLHRIACFRDDVVFLILMYQYRIYKVDKNRTNEYGQGGGPAAGETTESKPLPAPGSLAAKKSQ